MYARLAPSCWIVWEVPLHTLHLSSYLVWQTPAGMDPVLPWSVSLACLSVQLCPVTGRISGSQTRLNGKNKIWAIICTLPIVRYPAGRISWPKEAIEVTHIKTRRLLTVLGGFQPKSSTLTLSGRKVARIHEADQWIHQITVLTYYCRWTSQAAETQERGEQEEEAIRKDRSLHDMYRRTSASSCTCRQIDEVVDIKKSYWRNLDWKAEQRH